MLESKIHVMKERLWPMGIAAFTMHGLMIAAMALGILYSQGDSSQDFRAEVMFVPASEMKTDGLLISLSVGEGDSDRREDAGKGYLPLEKKHQGKRSFVATHPSSSALLRSPVNVSYKGKDKQSVTASVNSSSLSGGYPSEEQNNTIPIFNPPPIYPYEAKRKRLQGIVLVRLSLTETGVVHKATPLSPRIDPLLEDAALSAVYKWRFTSGSRTLEVPIEFKLET